MAKVTAATKGSMDNYLTTSETTAAEAAAVAGSAPGGGNKRRLGSRTDDVKRRRSMRTNSSGLDVQSDGYCWICHKVPYGTIFRTDTSMYQLCRGKLVLSNALS